MISLTRRQRVRLYFEPRPWKPVCKLGAAGLLLWLFSDLGLWVVSAALLAAIALVALDRMSPTDAEIDAWFQEVLHNIQKTGMARLGIVAGDPRQPLKQTLPVHGPVFRPQAGVGPDDVRARRGSDGAYRFSVNRVLVLYLMEHSLGIYACTYDAVRDIHVAVHSETYLYRNVVGVSVYEPAEVHDGTSEHSYQVGKKTFTPRQRFRITFKSGEDISLDVAVHDVNGRDSGRPMTRVDAVAAALRQMTIEVHARA